MRNDPTDPEAWHDYAEADLRRSVKRLAEGDLEDCVVHLQQCAEKAMKGKLIGSGWALEKTHNLIKLADELASHGIDVDWFDKTAGLLLAGYIGDRYPGMRDDEPDATTVTAALEETRRLFEELSGRKADQ
jgi:HEPN domain-containing protein